MKKVLLFFLVILFLSGCSTSYRLQQYYSQTFYQDFPPSDNVNIYALTDEGLNNLKDEGYLVLGYSSFVGPLQNPKMYQDFGKKIGADIVLTKSTYAETRHGNLSLPQYQPGQTYNIYSQGRGNIWSNNGSATYNSSSRSTITSSGKTVYRQTPVAVQRYDQYAIYLRKSH